MTRNRRYKTEVRVYQAAAGTPFMVARRQLALLAEVMQEHPLLTPYGIGVFEPWRFTRSEREAELAANREQFAGREAVVMETVVWLRENITPIVTPNFSSYSVKHVMEHATGLYVANGEFIAAALIADYTFRYDQPNVLFGMSARDMKRVQSALR